MNFVLDSVQRQKALTAAISAGNPELFLLIVLIESQLQDKPLSAILRTMESKIMITSHPVMKTLFSLLLGETTLISPALKHCVLHHRLTRCLAYFSNIASKIKLPTVRLINSNQMTQINPLDFSHLIASLIGVNPWSNHDDIICHLFGFTKENCLLSLEYYFLHYGMPQGIKALLENYSIVLHQGAELNAWIGLISVSQLMTYERMNRVLDYPSKCDAEVIAQFELFQDLYRVIIRKTPRIHPQFKLEKIPYDVSATQNLESEPNELLREIKKINQKNESCRKKDVWKLLILSCITFGFNLAVTFALGVFFNFIYIPAFNTSFNLFLLIIDMILRCVLLAIVALAAAYPLLTHEKHTQQQYRQEQSFHYRIMCVDLLEAHFDRLITWLAIVKNTHDLQPSLYFDCARLQTLLLMPLIPRTLTRTMPASISKVGTMQQHANWPIRKEPFSRDFGLEESQLRSLFFATLPNFKYRMSIEGKSIRLCELEERVFFRNEQ